MQVIIRTLLTITVLTVSFLSNIPPIYAVQAPASTQDLQEQQIVFNLPNLTIDPTQWSSTSCQQLLIIFMCNTPSGSTALPTATVNCTNPPTLYENSLTQDMKTGLYTPAKLVGNTSITMVDSTTKNQYFTPSNLCGGCYRMQTADNINYWRSIINISANALNEFYTTYCKASASTITTSAMFMTVTRLSSDIDPSFTCSNKSSTAASLKIASTTGTTSTTSTTGTTASSSNSICSNLFSSIYTSLSSSTAKLESTNHFCGNIAMASNISGKNSTLNLQDPGNMCYYNDGVTEYSTVDTLSDELNILSNFSKDPTKQFRPITYNLLWPVVNNNNYMLNNDGTLVSPDTFFAPTTNGFLGCKETKNSSGEYSFECIAAQLNSSSSCTSAITATFPAPFVCNPADTPCNSSTPTLSANSSSQCPSGATLTSLIASYPINSSSITATMATSSPITN